MEKKNNLFIKIISRILSGYFTLIKSSFFILLISVATILISIIITVPLWFFSTKFTVEYNIVTLIGFIIFIIAYSIIKIIAVFTKKAPPIILSNIAIWIFTGLLLFLLSNEQFLYFMILALFFIFLFEILKLKNLLLRGSIVKIPIIIFSFFSYIVLVLFSMKLFIYAIPITIIFFIYLGYVIDDTIRLKRKIRIN